MSGPLGTSGGVRDHSQLNNLSAEELAKTVYDDFIPSVTVLASDFDNQYVGQVVFIRSGTGEDQAARVVAYDGTTKVATICRNWDVVPDATSAYVMLPTGSMTSDGLKEAVWGSTSTRTLTQSAVAIASAVTGSTIALHRGDTLSASLTGLGNLTGYTKLWFTVKRQLSQSDTNSIIQIVNPGGLIYLNGAASTLP